MALGIDGANRSSQPALALRRSKSRSDTFAEWLACFLHHPSWATEKIVSLLQRRVLGKLVFEMGLIDCGAKPIPLLGAQKLHGPTIRFKTKVNWPGRTLEFANTHFRYVQLRGNAANQINYRPYLDKKIKATRGTENAESSFQHTIAQPI